LSSRVTVSSALRMCSGRGAFMREVYDRIRDMSLLSVPDIP
jgi:hypothetical protein